jgi:soluble lytic murein transglycosylase-like protein
VVLMIAIGAVMMAFRQPVGASQASAAAAPPGPSGVISPVFTGEIQRWAAAIVSWSSTAALDPNLVATVMQIESCGNPRALSRAGAIGLFQVMPYHFGALDDAFAPASNAARGLAYLARALEAAGGNARLAFAGYNGGIGVIGRSEWTWPDETVRYAYWGSGMYSDASSGAVDSPRLQEWLAAGGASLCRSASAQLGLP